MKWLKSIDIVLILFDLVVRNIRDLVNFKWILNVLWMIFSINSFLIFYGIYLDWKFKINIDLKWNLYGYFWVLLDGFGGYWLERGI